ncbi:MAG: hypothetical protein C4537_01035, partial [Acholeplasma sp.]
KKLLKVASGGIVFTTIQKFLPEDRKPEHELLSERRNIIVIADEAHRTQYGFEASLKDLVDKETKEVIGKRIAYGLAKYLRDALPNATYIGFTGTPIESNDVNTPQVFGQYVDIYDIAKSVEDGATVKIYYESRLAKVNLDEEGRRLIEEFDQELEQEELTETQKTKAQASIQRLPIQKGNTQTVSIMTFGFDPYLMEKNPYLGASYAIIDSIAKTVASGGNYQEIRFTFQEYFERLGKNASLWGKPFKALLGAYTTLKAWGLAAIGGKDSMSGSFESYHVPPTFISFAVSKGKIDDMISNALVKENSYLYLVKGEYDEHYRPKIELLKKLYESIYQKIKHKIILSAYALSFGGLIEALIKSTFGNRIGISVSTDLDVFKKDYGSILIESQIPIQEDHMIYLGRTTEEEIIDINKVTLTIDQAMTWNEARYQEIYPLYHHDERTHDIRIPLFNEIHEENAIHKREVHVLLPIFPGTNCEYDSERAFNRAGANVTSFVFNNLTQEDIQTSIHLLAHHLDQTDILMISGGFSSGDEPDGSGKFIANVLRHPLIAQAIRRLRLREGLILGICNGFQALIKSGLLPYGEIAEINEDDPNLHKNLLLRHVSKMVKTKVISTKSPWLKDMADEIHHMPISHGEGRLVMSDDTIETLIRHGQIAFQYVDDQGIPSYDPKINPNGSSYAIEGIISKDGLILGKMGHSERLDQELYKNIPYVKEQSIFRNAVTYIKQRGQKSWNYSTKVKLKRCIKQKMIKRLWFITKMMLQHSMELKKHKSSIKVNLTMQFHPSYSPI